MQFPNNSHKAALDSKTPSDHYAVGDRNVAAPCRCRDLHHVAVTTVRFRNQRFDFGALTPGLSSVILSLVKTVLTFLILLAALLAPARAGQKVVLFARLTDAAVVELSTGAKWRMDKGDAFPVIAYKESHTMVILQLAGAQFIVPVNKTEIVPDKELGDAITKYRDNVTNYINGYSDRWKKNAQEGKTE